MNSSDSFTRFHRNDGPLRRSWCLHAVKDADWVAVTTVNGSGRLSFVLSFARSARFVSEDDDDA